MLYFCKKSRRKVVHNKHCPCIQSVDVEGIGSFETEQEAYHAGYRLCRHCSPIAERYRKEHSALADFGPDSAVSVSFQERSIDIVTPDSRWKLVPDGEQVVLYHGNTYHRDSEGPVPGYHLQGVQKGTVAEYLDYIREHDFYRVIHPLPRKQKRKYDTPAMKGTKRYRKEQKRAAWKAKRQSANRVLQLIDSLNA